MCQKLKNIIALLLIVIILSPIVIKLEHRHEHIACHPTAEKQYHLFHEKCAVCCFEFSVFVPRNVLVFFEKLELTDRLTVCQPGEVFIIFSQFSFLLRAPPSFTNTL